MASFAPHSRSTVCAAVLYQSSMWDSTISSAASSMNKRENTLILDYWLAMPGRNMRKICKRLMHIRWCYSSNTWVSGSSRPTRGNTTIYCTPTMCWVLKIRHPPSSQQSFQAMCTLHVLQRGRGSIVSPTQ